MGVIPQTYPNNGKQGNRKKNETKKVSNSKRRSGRRDKYHKLPQECVMDRCMYGDQNSIIIETGL